MSNVRSILALCVSMLASASALADPANHVLSNHGAIAVPFTHSVGDTFVASASSASGFARADGSAVTTATIGGLSYFYDDFIFSLPSSPEASFNAAAVTIDLGSYLNLQNFQARLYKLDAGVASLTTGLPSSGTPVQAWSATGLLAVGLPVTGTTVLFQNVSLSAGSTYALEFRGTISGLAGGSYGGNVNIVPSPVPEPGNAALLFAGLAVVGALSRRRLG
jgi:hypothetical protein